MVIKKKKIIFIATFLVVTAIVLVLCVGYFSGEKKTEYDGTLVELQCRKDVI